jgi:hypothetical protein
LDVDRDAHPFRVNDLDPDCDADSYPVCDIHGDADRHAKRLALALAYGDSDQLANLHTHADSDRDSDFDSDVDSDLDADRDSHEFALHVANLDTDSDPQLHAVDHVYLFADRFAYDNAFADTNVDAYLDANADTHLDADGEPDPDADHVAYLDSDYDTDCHPVRDSDSNTNRDTNGFAHAFAYRDSIVVADL